MAQLHRHPGPTAEGDLSWFFLEGESSLGIRSNFIAMITPKKTGIPVESFAPNLSFALHEQDYEDHLIDRLSVIAKYRRIDRIFHRLAPVHRRTLSAYFSETPNPGPVRVYYEDLHIALLALTPTARALSASQHTDPRRAVQSALLGTKTKAKQIHTEAVAMFRAAIKEYQTLSMEDE